MDARKGGDIFPSEPSAPIIRSTRNKKNKTPRRQQRARKGGDVFPQNTKFPRVASLVNKISIEVPQRKKPLTSDTPDDNNLLLEGHVRCPTKGDHFLPKGTYPCKKQPSKRSPGTTRWQGGDVFLQKQNPRMSPSPTSPNKPPGRIYQKEGKHFS